MSKKGKHKGKWWQTWWPTRSKDILEKESQKEAVAPEEDVKLKESSPTEKALASFPMELSPGNARDILEKEPQKEAVAPEEDVKLKKSSPPKKAVASSPMKFSIRSARDILEKETHKETVAPEGDVQLKGLSPPKKDVSFSTTKLSLSNARDIPEKETHKETVAPEEDVKLKESSPPANALSPSPMKLSLRNSRDILEREPQKEAVAPEEDVQSKEPDPPAEGPPSPKKKLSFRAVSQELGEQPSQTVGGKPEGGEGKRREKLGFSTVGQELGEQPSQTIGGKPEGGEEKTTGRLSFSTIVGQELEGPSAQRGGGEAEGGKEKASPQERVTRELKDEQKQSEALYQELVSLAREVFEKVKEGHDFEIERVKNAINRLVDELVLGNEYMIRLAICTDEGYIPLASNAVNVTIISIRIGLALHYNKSSLVELGTVSFFRDIGLAQLSHIIEQPRQLKAGEYEEVKKHILYTERFLEGLGISNEVFKQAVLQHHERADGSGYPEHLKGEEIHEYAKIIAIAEVYESLTHNRPVREGLPPHSAMRTILEGGVAFFGHRVARAFIKEFGVYPVGSTVKLNTGEMAKVIAVHRDFPLRPVVQIVADSEGRPITKILNLLEKPQVFIKRPVDDGS